ncbi:hypothetical protein XA68_11757 [Ophiocordyceps unilateralis]|uniref:Uncharacterized protein n=1 Tax=Ophiocordyceps unilateralis TaxID=268505 RepID=A0A2A9PEC8_OPHUN|nr:hypothetical protein XA68_11757 [Ophiocordyceps unilateralis]
MQPIAIATFYGKGLAEGKKFEQKLVEAGGGDWHPNAKITFLEGALSARTLQAIAPVELPTDDFPAWLRRRNSSRPENRHESKDRDKNKNKSRDQQQSNRDPKDGKHDSFCSCCKIPGHRYHDLSDLGVGYSLKHSALINTLRQLTGLTTVKRKKGTVLLLRKALYGPRCGLHTVRKPHTWWKACRAYRKIYDKSLIPAKKITNEEEARKKIKQRFKEVPEERKKAKAWQPYPQQQGQQQKQERATITVTNSSTTSNPAANPDTEEAEENEPEGLLVPDHEVDNGQTQDQISEAEANTDFEGGYEGPAKKDPLHLDQLAGDPLTATRGYDLQWGAESSGQSYPPRRANASLRIYPLSSIGYHNPRNNPRDPKAASFAS